MPPSSFLVAILAGGSGTRFWPVGRRRRPKQALALDGDDPRPLLQITRDRVQGLGTGEPLIVAPRQLQELLSGLLPDHPPSAWLWEPAPRNTAAAIGLLAFSLPAEAVVVAVPADHHVDPPEGYRVVLEEMAARAGRTDAVLTLALRPTEPATGYGYLHLAEKIQDTRGGPIHRVQAYVEKPTEDRAREMLAAGQHSWNGGTFAFRAGIMQRLLEAHLPSLAQAMSAGLSDTGAGGGERLARAYRDLPALSIDHGLMERVAEVEAIVADLEWDDLGSWDAVARHRPVDRAGNLVRGEATLIGARNCLVEAAAGHVALLDVEDLIVVRTADTVLVAPRGKGEAVRRIVEALEREGREDLLR